MDAHGLPFCYHAVAAKINMVKWPIFGAYMPDTIKTFSSGGKNYLVTANEGDAKVWDQRCWQSGITARMLEPFVHG